MKNSFVEAKTSATVTIVKHVVDQKEPHEAEIILCAGKLRRWLNYILKSVVCCCLNMQKWCNTFCMKYTHTPHDLPKKCNDHEATFSIAHMLT